MQTRAACVLMALTVVVSAAAQSYAQDSVASANVWYQSIDVKGLLLSNLNFNFDGDRQHPNNFRTYDFDNQSYEMSLLDISIRHNASIGKAGFRADIDLGPHIPEIDHAYGLEMGKVDLRQAYLSYTANVGNGLTIDAGKFLTPCGYEVIEGSDGLSDNGSHSHLFGYAEPFTHTGIRLTYPVSQQLSVLLMAVNGWDNVIDNNASPSAGAQVTWKPAATSISVCSIIGPETPTDNLTRTLYDLSASTELTDFLMLGLAADYGREERLASEGELAPGPAIWNGIAGYCKLFSRSSFSVALRAEVFDDLDGIRTGTPQTLHEYTITPIWTITEGLIVKADLRYDLSSQPVFELKSGQKKSQSTVGLFGAYMF